MKVYVGNVYYFFFILIALVTYFVLFNILKNKSPEIQYKVILILLFINLFVHFTKIFFEPYWSGLPYTLRKVTFENVCAGTTLIYPFILLSKNKLLNNYMFFISLCGGIGALCFPTEALGNSILRYDTLRFYFCHIILFITPLLLASLKQFVPDYRLAFTIPMFFIAFELVIFVNEIFLVKVGAVSSTIDEFFDRNIRNSALIFGPSETFDGIAKAFLWMVPPFLRTDYFNLNVNDFYFPVLWMIIPVFIIFPILDFILVLPFNFNKIKKSFFERTKRNNNE